MLALSPEEAYNTFQQPVLRNGVHAGNFHSQEAAPVTACGVFSRPNRGNQSCVYNMISLMKT